MRRLLVKEWMTLDGVFDGEKMEEWFNPFHSDERGKYIQDTVLDSDAIIYGRLTYEMLAPYWSSLKNNEMGIADKLNSVPKYVVSSTLKKADWNNSTIIKDNIKEEISELKKQKGSQILIDGSATLVHSLMESDLIDEYQFLVHPIVMGSGKNFFKNADKSNLKLIEAKILSPGVVLLRYKSNNKDKS